MARVEVAGTHAPNPPFPSAKKIRLEQMAREKAERERREREAQRQQQLDVERPARETAESPTKSKEKEEKEKRLSVAPPAANGMGDLLEQERQKLRAYIKEAKEVGGGAGRGKETQGFKLIAPLPPQAGRKDEVEALQVQLRELEAFKAESKAAK